MILRLLRKLRTIRRIIQPAITSDQNQDVVCQNMAGVRRLGINRSRELAACLGLALFLSSAADAQQFRPSSLPGPPPTAIPQELLQSKIRHADALRAQMYRAQQEQGAPDGFAESAFQAQQAYLAEQAYQEYLAYQKKLQQTGGIVDTGTTYSTPPQRLPRPQANTSFSAYPETHASQQGQVNQQASMSQLGQMNQPVAQSSQSVQATHSGQVSQISQPSFSQPNLAQTNAAAHTRAPSTFAPPVHVKPTAYNSYNFNDAANRPQTAAEPIARPSNAPAKNFQQPYVLQEYGSEGLQDRIANILAKPRYQQADASTAARRPAPAQTPQRFVNPPSAVDSRQVASGRQVRSPVRGPVRGPIRGSNQVQRQRETVNQYQAQTAPEVQVAKQSRQPSFDSPTLAELPIGTGTLPNADVALQERMEQMLRARGNPIQQVGMVAPAQDPFNDQSLALPEDFTRPSMRSPRGEYRPVQPPREISVLSSDPAKENRIENRSDNRTEEIPDVPTNSFRPSGFAREGVSPPPMQDDVQFGSASPLRDAPQVDDLPEEIADELDPYPSDIVLDGPAPSQMRNSQDDDTLLRGLESETQPPQGRTVGNSFRSEARQDETPGRLITKTCDEFRDNLLNRSIRDIALDISPPASANRSQYQPISRSWTDRDGNVIANGAMVDLRRGYVIVDGDEGLQKIAYARLSPADWAAVAQYWQIPVPCDVGIDGDASRNWIPQTFTWKASALCHKPLYFEDVQLERYGHTHGPISQPVRSVAHFFVSFVSWPYQTAIHPPNECQYALGYYRPGDCAPWLKDPIPLSLGGLGRQALVTGAVIAIP